MMALGSNVFVTEALIQTLPSTGGSVGQLDRGRCALAWQSLFYPPGHPKPFIGIDTAALLTGHCVHLPGLFGQVRGVRGVQVIHLITTTVVVDKVSK